MTALRSALAGLLLISCAAGRAPCDTSEGYAPGDARACYTPEPGADCAGGATLTPADLPDVRYLHPACTAVGVYGTADPFPASGDACCYSLQAECPEVCP
ncbi:MAG: hypothetical protein R3F61_30010 [Myxococcota bacterium]